MFAALHYICFIMCYSNPSKSVIPMGHILLVVPLPLWRPLPSMLGGGGAVVVSGCWSDLLCIPGSAEVGTAIRWCAAPGPGGVHLFPPLSDARSLSIAVWGRRHGVPTLPVFVFVLHTHTLPYTPTPLITDTDLLSYFPCINKCGYFLEPRRSSRSGLQFQSRAVTSGGSSVSVNEVRGGCSVTSVHSCCWLRCLWMNAQLIARESCWQGLTKFLFNEAAVWRVELPVGRLLFL